MALTDEEWARIVVDRQRTPEQAGALRNAAQALVDGMETCHQCKGTVLVDEQPVHCEDCSSDCDNHEGAECPTIYGLHLQLKTLLAERTPATAPAPQSTEDVVELARKIVNRLVTDAIGLQWTRNIADALAGHNAEPLTEKDLTEDALALATGDDIGCLDEQDEDFREQIGLYWLEDLLTAALAEARHGTYSAAEIEKAMRDTPELGNPARNYKDVDRLIKRVLARLASKELQK